MPDITKLATKTTLSAKINEVKAEVPSISNLATTSALTTVENKISNVSNLVKKNNNTKINETEKKIIGHNHDKYITTKECNKLTAETFAARLAQAKLAAKRDIANFVKKTDFDEKLDNLNKNITLNKAKHLIIKNELKNYKHLIQTSLLIKITLIMMEHNFT